MKRRWLVLLGLLLLAPPPVVQAQSGSGDGYSYIINATNTNTITITNYTGTNAVVTIPTNINNLTVTGIGNGYSSPFSAVRFRLTGVTIPNSVTSIGEYAFEACTNLQNVTIGNAVGEIEAYAFYDCAILTSITIPNSVTNIGDSAFDSCMYLTNATIGNSVTSIGEDAFDDCTGLTNVTIPGSVTNIGDSAFDYCTNLTSVTIPNSVTSLGEYTFNYCTELTNASIGNGVTNIGNGAFQSCTSLIAITVDPNNALYSSVNGVLFNKSLTTLIQYPGGINGGYTFPNGVTSIGDSGFDGCIRLTSITIPNSVTNIGDSAFDYCIRLTSVTIPSGVTSIGDTMFADCYSLTSVTIGNGVTNIGAFAFSQCYDLTRVGIPNSVISIGQDAFYDCSGLMGFYFQGNAPTADSTVFSGDSNGIVYYQQGTTGWSPTFSGLPTALWIQFSYTTQISAITITNYNGPGGAVIIPDSINGLPVTIIGNSAFLDYPSLTVVTIPNNVASIGTAAFESCGLTSVTIPNSVTSIGPDAFYDCMYLTNVTIGNSVTNIGAEAFVLCTSLTNVTIGDRVTSIGDSAFASCYSLTRVGIPNSVTSLGDYAFAGSGLRSIYFQGNAPTADSTVFYGDNNATVYYQQGTTGWGSTFAGHPTALWIPFSYTAQSDTIIITNYNGPGGAVIIPDSINGLPVTSIGEDAFAGASLTSITIPDSVTNIAAEAFESCIYLTSVYFQGNAPTANPTVFQSDNNATVYYLTGATGWDSTFGGVSTMLWYLPVPFNYTTQNDTTTITGYLGSKGAVVIPDTINGLPVTSIGEAAFLGYTNLTSVMIPNGVTSIGTGAFFNCPNLISITIPGSVTNIGDSAFVACTSLTNATILNGVTSIGGAAFNDCTSLTSINIPSSVTNIGDSAFAGCTSLIAINVDTNNSYYSSLNGVLFDKSQNTLVEYPGGMGGSYTIPSSATSIGQSAFFYCSGLTSVTIGNSVTNIGGQAFAQCYSLTNATLASGVTSIGDDAFSGTALTSITVPASVTYIGPNAFSFCSSLTSVYFQGNAPVASSEMFLYDNATVYYLPGTIGWNSSFAGLPAALWLLPNPLILNNGPSFGMQTNGFGFIISWATNISIIVEACTNLAKPVWTPLQTNTLTNGSFYFSEPLQTNSPGHYYRIISL